MKGLISLIILFISFNVLSQTREEIVEQFMKERKQMMEQMIKIFQDDFNNDDFFKDDIDPFKKGSSFKSFGTNVLIEEKYENDGSISIIITPKTQNMSLDIQTKKNSIVIKTELNITESKDQGEQSSRFSSKSSSTKSIQIPQGYKAVSPVGYGKGIKVSLVPLEGIKKKSVPKKKFHKKMIPIGKRPGEETI
jgi:hypothetical protein